MGTKSKPVAERRGVSKHLTGVAMLVEAAGGTGDADLLLDTMLEAGWIGGVRRSVTEEVLAESLPRPVGPWGLLVQLVGHPWTYLRGDSLWYEWPKELAAKLGRRAALFEINGQHGSLYARAYQG